jgi:hypothetical protein
MTYSQNNTLALVNTIKITDLIEETFLSKDKTSLDFDFIYRPFHSHKEAYEEYESEDLFQASISWSYQFLGFGSTSQFQKTRHNYASHSSLILNFYSDGNPIIFINEILRLFPTTYAILKTSYKDEEPRHFFQNIHSMGPIELQINPLGITTFTSGHMTFAPPKLNEVIQLIEENWTTDFIQI